ncbi:MAG: hypothetical protein FJ390_06370 [Verrucomicrobia bacterium]|nr:hypothetical protein [Verrucomicrobiota bacterium]
MSTIFPSLSKNPKPNDIQDFLNAIAIYLQQKSQSDFNKLDQKENPLDATSAVTDDLVTDLFQKIPTEALALIGNYLISHPDAIATASTAAAGTSPNPTTVGVLGLMMMLTSSTTSSALATKASANLEEFMKTYSK